MNLRSEFTRRFKNGTYRLVFLAVLAVALAVSAFADIYQSCGGKSYPLPYCGGGLYAGGNCVCSTVACGPFGIFSCTSCSYSAGTCPPPGGGGDN